MAGVGERYLSAKELQEYTQRHEENKLREMTQQRVGSYELTENIWVEGKEVQKGVVLTFVGIEKGLAEYTTKNGMTLRVVPNGVEERKLSKI